jgi:hypothetical protein
MFHLCREKTMYLYYTLYLLGLKKSFLEERYDLKMPLNVLGGGAE